MFQGQPYWIEERLPGISAADAMQNPDVRQAALGSALEAVEHLHRRTAIEVSVDDKLLDEWVFHPVQNIRSSTLVNYHRQGHALLNQLEMYLSEKLRDQRLVMGWIHGDYWPANVLVTSDGSQVTGIVDWDLSQPMGLPSLDFVNLLISTRRIMEEKELGEILAEILRRGAWREHEQKLWEQKSQVLGGKLPEIKDALLIFWLQHLNAKLTKKGRHMVNPLWAYKNFAPVLNAL
jgi:aminoglycoside phosphotransferase (APT) family kinase protein